ncbi:hypothetical protein MUO79_10215 [Candidatus Bathyarchaeota archaeon]|nr:hypothetical protein [Candidatus Bathyarchaeota archaeon]
MTCLKHLALKNPKALTFDQLIQMACELELEINRANNSQNVKAQKVLENASEYIPHILEWLTTAQKETDK